MVIATVFGLISLVFLVLNFIVTLKITKILALNGVDINYPLLHIRIYRYAGMYKNITEKKDGQVGPLYRQFIITNRLFLFFLALGILSVYIS